MAANGSEELEGAGLLPAMTGNSEDASWIVDIATGEGKAKEPSRCSGSISSVGLRQDPSCRRIHHLCGFGEVVTTLCVDCAFLDEGHFEGSRIEAFLRHCRATRETLDHFPVLTLASTVATILLSGNGRILDLDTKGQAFLKTHGMAKVVNERLYWSDAEMHCRFTAALEETARTGKGRNLLYCHASNPKERFGVIVAKVDSNSHENNKIQPTEYPIVCWVAPLDRRRFATARQLMELFDLSPAEARLTRALCLGDSLEEYALEQGVKLPTVRSQIRSVFAKTGTDRQATLILLIAGIPVLRETS